MSYRSLLFLFQRRVNMARIPAFRSVSGLAIALLAAAQPVFAQSSWSGATDGQWDNVGNWIFGGLPATQLPQNQSNKSVVFNSGAANHNVSLSTDVNLGATGSVSFTVSSGNFTFDLGGHALTYVTFIYGSGAGNTASASYQGAGSVSVGALTVGAAGSAGNTFRYSDVFANDVAVTWRDANILTIGSASGGINNSFIVDAGKSASFAGATINSGGSLASNNRIEVDGGVLTLSKSSLAVNGFFDGLTRSGNQVWIHDNGQLNFTGASTRNATFSAGTDLIVESGGSVTWTDASTGNLNFNADATLLMDGGQLSKIAGAGTFTLSGASATPGSQKASATIRNGSTFSYNGAWTIGGDLSATDSSLTAGSTVSVGANAHLSLDASTMEAGATTVSGLMEVLNGSTYTATGNLSTNGTGQLVVDGAGTQVNVSGLFSANAVISGGAQVNVGSFGGGGISLEEGSAFRFETWTGAGELAVGGKVTWGAGNDASTTMMKVMAGTTLVLDGGSYKLGRFGLMEGSALEGSGVIDATMESTSGGVGGPLDGGVQGASINPGTEDSVGRLEFTQNVVFFNSTSQITFSILDADNYDQIAGNLLIGNELVIKLELMQPLEDMIASFEAGVTSFQLVSAAAGGPISLSLAGEGQIIYDFDGTDEALAAYGLAWDTSNFISTGAIGLVAVPEPSAFVLLGLGATLALGRRRKRSAALAA